MGKKKTSRRAEMLKKEMEDEKDGNINYYASIIIMNNFKYATIAGVAFGLLLGLCFGWLNGLHYGLFAGLLSGILFGAGIYLFVSSKMVQKQTALKVHNGEAIIHSGAANHFKNGEGVGGKLYLLASGLQFQSHRFNIQNHSLLIEISAITKVSLHKTLGIIPNGLSVTANGKTEKFVVNNRRVWLEKIEKFRRI